MEDTVSTIGITTTLVTGGMTERRPKTNPSMPNTQSQVAKKRINMQQPALRGNQPISTKMLNSLTKLPSSCPKWGFLDAMAEITGRGTTND